MTFALFLPWTTSKTNAQHAHRVTCILQFGGGQCWTMPHITASEGNVTSCCKLDFTLSDTAQKNTRVLHSAANFSNPSFVSFVLSTMCQTTSNSPCRLIHFFGNVWQCRTLHLADPSYCFHLYISLGYCAKGHSTKGHSDTGYFDFLGMLDKTTTLNLAAQFLFLKAKPNKDA